MLLQLAGFGARQIAAKCNEPGHFEGGESLTQECQDFVGQLLAAFALMQLDDSLHSLADHPYVIDIRNIGLIGAIELQPIEGAPTKRAFSAFLKAFEKGFLIRTTGDIIALSPPLIITKQQIDELIGAVGEVLKSI